MSKIINLVNGTPGVYPFQKGESMDPEKLLHEAALMLRAEAEKGPGTMFLLSRLGGFIVTRAPAPGDIKQIIAEYNCMLFCKGLTPAGWSSLLKKIWEAHTATQKGGASEQ